MSTYSGSIANSTSTEYLSGMSLEDYLTLVRDHHPFLFERLSEQRLSERVLNNLIGKWDAQGWEFDDGEAGGRGEAYNASQRIPGNRAVGVRLLLEYFQDRSTTSVPPIVVDALAGDGTIARLLEASGIHQYQIISADISKFMVSATLGNGLPAIRQAAGYSLLDDCSVDGVLIAYGSHHLPDDERTAALIEAHRTLRPGGRAVLHDFEIGGATARWFESVVHRYSSTGHPHPHFDRSELLTRFTEAGFDEVLIRTIPDPFTLPGASAENAREAAVEHMRQMYDLTKLPTDDLHDSTEYLAARIEEIFGPIRTEKRGPRHWATIPREALIAVGTKA